MRLTHATAPLFRVVVDRNMPYISNHCLLHCSEPRVSAAFSAFSFPGAMPGFGSSDPTSPRREASLFDLAPGE